ncbi:MAG: PqqD family peptide modification chaperone [Variibacter sp.]
MDPNSVPIQRRGYRVEELEGEVVLYRAPVKKTIYLNESATTVWTLCDGQRTVTQIADVLAEAYPDNAAEVRADVRDAIDNLVSEGALRLMQRAGDKPAASGAEGSARLADDTSP